MSQLILDEQLDEQRVLRPVQKWITAASLPDLRPREHIFDDRVPEILRTLKQPTFVTIDAGFWDRGWCHPGYCILHFALRREEQGLIPKLLRALLRLQPFRTRALRMGKVVHVSTATIAYWELNKQEIQHTSWGKRSHKKR